MWLANEQSIYSVIQDSKVASRRFEQKQTMAASSTNCLFWEGSRLGEWCFYSRKKINSSQKREVEWMVRNITLSYLFVTNSFSLVMKVV